MFARNASTAILRTAFALLLGMLCLAPTLADEPPMGFVLHYPNFTDGIDELPNTGATTLVIQGGGAFLASEPLEGKFDFSHMDKEIAYCEQHNLKMVLLIECNPLFTPQWLIEKVRAAGEMCMTPDGKESGNVPSISSKVFRQYQEEFIRRTIEHAMARDTNRVITHVQLGAEWWFPDQGRYNALDVAKFREWLAGKYGSIRALNAAWKSGYKSFDVVPAPGMGFSYASSKRGQSTVLSLDTGSQDCSWSAADTAGKSNVQAVTPGKTYTFSAWAKCSSFLGQGPFLELAWLKPEGGAPIQVEHSNSLHPANGWQQLSVTAKAPAGASKAWLLMKFAGTGSALYDDVEFRESGSPRNLAANPGLESGGAQPAVWSFQNWLGGANVKSEYLKTGGRKNGKCVRIAIAQVPASYRNVDAAIVDWSNYWYEAGARYINGLAGFAKTVDPTRKTITYLTFSFAYPIEWDYVQQMGVQPDMVAMKGKDIDVHSMQLSAADGDPFRVTCVMDIVRKYGKPISAVDLQDFTSGVHIGYPKLDRITQATVQHGAEGFFYYCWHGMVPPYDFYPNVSTSDMNRLIVHARTTRKLVEGMSVRPKVALVEPILPASPSDIDGYKNDYRSFAGWYNILLGMHQTFDVVTLNELSDGTDRLSRYKWVITPDCAYLPVKALSSLAAYSRSGGKLITSGRFAQFDDHRSPITQGRPKVAMSLPDFGKEYTGTIERRAGGNTPALFIWRKDTPKTEKAFAQARNKLSAYLKSAGLQPDVEIGPNAPSLRCVMYDGAGSRAAYLVNMADAPSRGQKLRFRHPGIGPVSVHADGQLVGCRSKRTGAWVEIELPEFRTSCIVKSRSAAD